MAVGEVLVHDFNLALKLDLCGSWFPVCCGNWIGVAGCWIMSEEKGTAEQHESGENCVADRSGATRP